MTEHITHPRDSKNPESDPPGAVSNQNGEETQTGHSDHGERPDPPAREVKEQQGR